MWEAPIVAEVRQIREDYAAQYNLDVHALCRALKEHERRDPRPKASFPPKPAKPAHKARPAAVLAESKTPCEAEDK